MRRLAALTLMAAGLAACGGSSTGQSVPGTPAAHAAPVTTSTTPAPARRHASTPKRPPHRPSSTRRAAHRSKPRLRSNHPKTTITTTSSKTKTASTSTTTSSTTPQRAAVYTVTLLLHGGGNGEFQACGAQHHFRTYPTGSRIVFSGTVSPLPSVSWKVKLKIKVCSHGTFVDFVKLDSSRNKHTGSFGGTFAAPAPGDYEARAELYLNDVKTARSDNPHFATL